MPGSQELSLPERAHRFARSFRRLEPAERWALVRLTLLRHLGIRPDRAPRSVGRPRSVLFVCHGNILRSPMAAVLYRRELLADGRGNDEVLSAGIRPPNGRPADPRGRRLAPDFGVSLEDHSSQVVTPDLMHRAELILAMDRTIEAQLAARYPDSERKLALLGSYAPEPADPVIPDPFSGTDEAVEACYHRIERAVRGLSADLLEYPPVPPEPQGRIKRLTRGLVTGPAFLAAAENRSGGHAPVFLLHRFASADHGTYAFPGLTLRRYLEWLRRRRYHLAAVGDLVATRREGRPIPPRTVAFTVDDGYDDFAQVAAPIFAEFDCPVTVFLVTDFLDGHTWLWWDRVKFAFAQTSRRECTLTLGGQPFRLSWDSALRRERAAVALIEAIKWYPTGQRDALIAEAAALLDVEIPTRPPTAQAPMTWDTVRRLAAAGVAFGPHSRTHPIHSAEDDATSRREIAGSWQRLREELPGALPLYCYPNGDERSFGARETRFLTELGLLPGVSARPGYVSTRAPAGPIPRFTLDGDAVRFAQMASGIERLKSSWRR